MTDEEKAEEYAIKITDELRNKGFLTNEEINQRYAGIVQGVLYGLAEGRKETFSEEVIKNLKENTSVINSVIINKLSEKCEELEKENAELKGELRAVREILEELKESYNAVLDEVIDTARGYGLVSDSALFCYINEYDNKEINYDELLDKIRNETIIELKLAIEDMKK